MRTFDLAPLYRATVGFDQIADLMDRVLADTAGTAASYPPYNIEKTATTPGASRSPSPASRTRIFRSRSAKAP
jgi:hypothetical protein